MRRSLYIDTEKRRRIERRRIFALALVVTVCSALCWITRGGTNLSTQPKAVIIDGLVDYPNPSFVEEATSYLNASGFSVDYISNEGVTVDFYRRLPSLGYSIVIFRVHCGPLIVKMPNGTEVAGQDLVLFTAEKYDQKKYALEQASGQLAKASIVDVPGEEYFAVLPRFITQCMEREFKDAIIIVDSCYGCYSMSMAEAFVSQGSEVFIGWSGEVGADHSDAAVLAILKGICVDGLDMKSAVEETMNKVGPDPYSGSSILFYPSDKGDYALKGAP